MEPPHWLSGQEIEPIEPSGILELLDTEGLFGRKDRELSCLQLTGFLQEMELSSADWTGSR